MHRTSSARFLGIEWLVRINQLRPNCECNQPIWVTKRQMATDCIRCVAVHRIDAVVSRNMSNPDGRTPPAGHMPTNISITIPSPQRRSVIVSYQLRSARSDCRYPPTFNTHPPSTKFRLPTFTPFTVAKVSKSSRSRRRITASIPERHAGPPSGRGRSTPSSLSGFDKPSDPAPRMPRHRHRQHSHRHADESVQHAPGGGPGEPRRQPARAHA